MKRFILLIFISLLIVPTAYSQGSYYSGGGYGLPYLREVFFTLNAPNQIVTQTPNFSAGLISSGAGDVQIGTATTLSNLFIANASGQIDHVDDLTLDPAGNDTILDNSHLQIQGTYDLLFKGAGTITHESNTDHYTETFMNDADTGWYWDDSFNGRLYYDYNGSHAFVFDDDMIGVRNGWVLWIDSLGDDKALKFYHNDTNGVIETSSGGLTLNSAGNINILDPVVNEPSTTQVIDAVGDAILANAAMVVLNPNGDYTLTSTPTIADGTIGQELKIVCANGEANIVTVQDEAGLAGSNLQLGAATRALTGKKVLKLTFDGTDWIEDYYANN